MATSLSVNCLLVMGCGNYERCRLAEELLVQRGFQARFVSEDGGSCVRSFVRDYASGSAESLLTEVCTELEAAISPDAHDWKAFVQIFGSDTAWATMQAGKPLLRGSSSLP